MHRISIGNNQSEVSFSRNGNKINNQVVLVNMNDSELRNLAYDISNDEKEQIKQKKSILRTFIAIPVVASLANGILTKEIISVGKDGIAKTFKATLGDKALITAKSAGYFAGILAAFGIYNAAKAKVESKSPEIRNFNDEHPLLSLLTDVGIIAACLIIGKKGISALKGKNLSIFNKLSENSNKIKKLVDSSKFNEKIIPKIINFSDSIKNKAPFLATTAKFLLERSIWVLLGIGFIKSSYYSSKNKKKVNVNYEKLKNVQFELVKKINTNINVERDVLAQDDPRQADDLRKIVNGEKIFSKKDLAQIKNLDLVYQALASKQ